MVGLDPGSLDPRVRDDGDVGSHVRLQEQARNLVNNGLLNSSEIILSVYYSPLR